MAAIWVGYHSRPSFLIIGAQKGGTSALHAYLSEHSHVMPATKKEIGFFHKDVAYDRGLIWYHSHFPLPHHLGDGAVTFEATPEYLYSAKSARRIHRYDPDIRLAVLLRDPVDRAYSHWNMLRKMLRRKPEFLFQRTRDSDPAVRAWADRILANESFPGFGEAVREELEMIEANDPAPEPSYLRRGLYYEQLMTYLRYFDRDQVMVIDSRSLIHDRVETLGKIGEFLQLPAHEWSSEDLALRNVNVYQEDLSARARVFLRDFYRPHNEKLYQLLGRDFGW